MSTKKEARTYGLFNREILFYRVDFC